MGFFSSLLGSPKVNTPASGFYSQPQAYQSLYNNVATNANAAIPQLNAQMFTPTPLNVGEKTALNNVYQGFTPNAAQLQSDIQMLQNPFDEYVINGINREATGQNSLVNQFASRAGQQGSNRSFLGSSDVEQNRLNNIGTFKQNQYNNAINNSLGALSQGRRNDAAGALSAGDYERNLAMQTNQAPLSAIQAQLGLLGGFPTQFGNFGQQASSQGGGLDAGKVVNTAATIAGFFSDRELKENIDFVGLENGHKVYEFNYKGDPKRWVGVMAQDVQEICPKAVREKDGYLTVDYDMIGVKMREAE